MDLDRFKFVNDTFGHDIGDKLLREVGKVLRSNVRANDLVGRVGGDEFMVALLGVTDSDSAGQVARSLVRELSAPIAVEERELQVSASIGISLFPRDGTNAEEGRAILANAGIPESKLRSEPTMLDAARTAVALANGSK